MSLIKDQETETSLEHRPYGSRAPSKQGHPTVGLSREDKETFGLILS